MVTRYFSRFFLPALLCLGSTLTFAADSSACTPNFPLKNGWLGGDAAYSIPMPDGRVFWTFGDTLIGKKRVVIGDEPVMVRNSIGISTCKSGKWNIDYVIRKSATGKQLDYFQARNRKFWYWPLDGVYHDGSLYVTLLCLRSKPRTKEDPLGFETCGVDLARVSDLNLDPQDWTVESFPLVADGVAAYPSAAATVDGEFAYLFALYEKGSRPNILTRIPLAGLGDPQKNLEYYAKDGTWKHGFDPADAATVMKHGNTELSLKYHPEMKKWVAVLMDPNLTGKILLRTAPEITGPWTEGVEIYELPEMQKSRPGYDSDTTCYAGKEHPQFENGDLVFTYTCNTLSVPKLATKLDIYFPVVIRMPMPKE